MLSENASLLSDSIYLLRFAEGGFRSEFAIGPNQSYTIQEQIVRVVYTYCPRSFGMAIKEDTRERHFNLLVGFAEYKTIVHQVSAF